MSKQVLTKIALDEINELLNKTTLQPKEPQELYYNGAYIRLFDTDIFKEEKEKREIQAKYYRIFGNKVFYLRTFVYNFPSSNQILMGQKYFDKPEVSFQIIQPTMDLENLLKSYQEVA